MNKKEQHEKNRLHNQVRKDEAIINTLTTIKIDSDVSVTIGWIERDSFDSPKAMEGNLNNDEKLFIHAFHHMELFLRERIRINNYKLSNL